MLHSFQKELKTQLPRFLDRYHDGLSAVSRIDVAGLFRRPTDAPLSKTLHAVFPVLGWWARYTPERMSNDAVAAFIVAIMIIPQSLAYAMLAGLPPHIGMYASILPLVAYAIFGTSSALCVGPVAVISLMTASALAKIALPGSSEYMVAAIALALLVGVIMLAMGLFRLGLIANLLSHPVISGFITASGLLIAAGQLKHILGINAEGDGLHQLLPALLQNVSQTNVPTLVLGLATLSFLVWARRSLKDRLIRFGLNRRAAEILGKAAPVAAVIATSLAAWALGLASAGVKVVGELPTGLPPLSMPRLDLVLWTQLLSSALLISLVGFVESVSVGQALAAKRRERIDPDQELIGLGAANIAAAFTGGYPVAGGFSRSVVNYDAGASTPIAGAMTAAVLALIAMTLMPVLYYLPQATLAATIMVAVLSLVDFDALRRTWAYSRSDLWAMLGTILLTLSSGVEVGIVTGVVLSILLHLWRTSRPHIAIVGQVPGTEHFRNVRRHDVITCPTIVSVRVDESLYFPNARFLEDKIAEIVADNQQVKHVILVCPAINHIDASALESLEAINRNLKDAGVSLHLSEVKGPVMDRLKRSHLLEHLTGRIFLSQFDAFSALSTAVPASARVKS